MKVQRQSEKFCITGLTVVSYNCNKDGHWFDKDGECEKCGHLDPFRWRGCDCKYCSGSTKFEDEGSDTPPEPEDVKGSYPGELSGIGVTRSIQGCAKNMSPDEEEHMKGYYAEDSDGINKQLRSRRPSGDYDYRDHISNIDSLMKKVPKFTIPVHLHRGMDEGSASKVFGEPGDKVGQVLKNKSYFSTSSRASIASGFGKTHIHIHAGPGTKALNERSVYPYGGEDTSEEGEFTFPRNSRFKVQDDTINPSGERHIHLKALAPSEEKDLEHFSRYI